MTPAKLKGDPMKADHIDYCGLCGHAQPGTVHSRYGEFCCERCGQRHVHDEGMQIQLTCEQIALLLRAKGIEPEQEGGDAL